MTIIGPCWLITQNSTLLLSTMASTIIICHVVITVHDAIHYPSQHPHMQNQKWFKFLDNHHLIHHINTEKNVNFLLPICDFLFGTIRLSLNEKEINKYGTLYLAKKFTHCLTHRRNIMLTAHFTYHFHFQIHFTCDITDHSKNKISLTLMFPDTLSDLIFVSFPDRN